MEKCQGPVHIIVAKVILQLVCGVHLHLLNQQRCQVGYPVNDGITAQDFIIEQCHVVVKDLDGGGNVHGIECQEPFDRRCCCSIHQTFVKIVSDQLLY